MLAQCGDSALARSELVSSDVECTEVTEANRLGFSRGCGSRGYILQRARNNIIREYHSIHISRSLFRHVRYTPRIHKSANTDVTCTVARKYEDGILGILGIYRCQASTLIRISVVRAMRPHERTSANAGGALENPAGTLIVRSELNLNKQLNKYWRELLCHRNSFLPLVYLLAPSSFLHICPLDRSAFAFRPFILPHDS